uniref:Uncharacterized protein n=1 Tax=Leersia perrieri TaxID=77586 RepID=A0A0D9W0D8_9ORYZ
MISPGIFFVRPETFEQLEVSKDLFGKASSYLKDLAGAPAGARGSAVATLGWRQCGTSDAAEARCGRVGAGYVDNAWTVGGWRSPPTGDGVLHGRRWQRFG